MKLEAVVGSEAVRAALKDSVALQPASRNLKECIDLDIRWFATFDLSRAWSLEVLQLDSSAQPRHDFAPCVLWADRLAVSRRYRIWTPGRASRPDRTTRPTPALPAPAAPLALEDGREELGDEGDDLDGDCLSSCGSGSDVDWWEDRPIYDDLGVHCLLTSILGEDVVLRSTNRHDTFVRQSTLDTAARENWSPRCLNDTTQDLIGPYPKFFFASLVATFEFLKFGLPGGHILALLVANRFLCPHSSAGLTTLPQSIESLAMSQHSLVRRRNFLSWHRRRVVQLLP